MTILRRVSWTGAALSSMLAACAAPGAAPASAPASAPAPAATSAAAAPASGVKEIFNYGRFGAISIYGRSSHPREVVLFVSGDRGWDAAAGSLAKRLADTGALVAGIDIRHYREQLEQAPEECVAPASDFENLSHYLQSKLQMKQYLEPLLVGTESGAAFVYVTLADAPEGLFKGALGIGFSPELELRKSPCDNAVLTARARRDDTGSLLGFTLSAARALPGKWVTLPATASMPQFDAAYARLAVMHADVKAAPLPAALADLPLIIVPAVPRAGGQWFGVFLTGDGGWVGLDKGVSLELAKHDIPVVGWDSLKYFWSRRTPEGASRDLDRVLRYYSHAWGRSHVLLIGYSQGADTMPFMVNRLPAPSHALVGYTALLGISDNALWEFHLASWLGNPPKGIPTAPELEHWSGSPYLCIYGESDGDAACAQLTGHDGTALKLAGGHHFGGGYARIADEILSRLPVLAPK